MCAAITIQELSKIDDPYPITTADELAEAFVVYNEYGSMHMYNLGHGVERGLPTGFSKVDFT